MSQEQADVEKAFLMAADVEGARNHLNLGYVDPTTKERKEGLSSVKLRNLLRTSADEPTRKAAYEQGLRAILIPTDQGDYEPDDSATVLIKVGQQFGIKSSTKGPIVVADKTDIVGKFCLPLYKYLARLACKPTDTFVMPVPSFKIGRAHV